MTMLVPALLFALPLAGAPHHLAASTHACALDDNGALSCWGYDFFRQLGFVATEKCNTMPCSKVPQRVKAPAKLRAVSTGDETTCVVDVAGAVWCFGEGNAGQLGADPRARCSNELNAWPCSDEPVRIPKLSNVVALAVGGSSCAVTKDGELLCWGYRGDVIGNAGPDEACPGNLGETAPRGGKGRAPAMGAMGVPCRRTPERRSELGDVVDVAVGQEHACAVTRDGAVWCWGKNKMGQLGLGNNVGDAGVKKPTRVPGVADVVGIVASFNDTCAWQKDGRAFCWGADDGGQIGVATDEMCMGLFQCAKSPREVVHDVAEVSIGATHACARHRDGTVSCWGAAESPDGGMVACTAPGLSCTPRKMPGIAAATELAVGVGFACVRDDGVVKCWGSNRLGSLGDGSTVPHIAPLPVARARAAVARTPSAGVDEVDELDKAPPPPPPEKVPGFRVDVRGTSAGGETYVRLDDDDDGCLLTVDASGSYRLGCAPHDVADAVWAEPLASLHLTSLAPAKGARIQCNGSECAVQIGRTESRVILDVAETAPITAYALPAPVAQRGAGMVDAPVLLLGRVAQKPDRFVWGISDEHGGSTGDTSRALDTPGVRAGAQRQAARLLAQAEQALSVGRAPDAKRLLRSSIASDGYRVEPWLKLGDIAREAGDESGTADALRGASAVDLAAAAAWLAAFYRGTPGVGRGPTSLDYAVYYHRIDVGIARSKPPTVDVVRAGLKSIATFDKLCFPLAGMDKATAPQSPWLVSFSVRQDGSVDDVKLDEANPVRSTPWGRCVAATIATTAFWGPLFGDGVLASARVEGVDPANIEAPFTVTPSSLP